VIHTFAWLKTTETTDPLFASTACLDAKGSVVLPAGLKLSTRGIDRIITEGLLLAGVKKPEIIVRP
jgi:hypothetical protein